MSATPVYPGLTRGEMFNKLMKRAKNITGYAQDGIAGSGTTTTIVDTVGLQRYTANNDSGVYQKTAYIFKGTNAGAYRFITTFTTATSTATVAPAFASAITSTSEYCIIDQNLVTVTMGDDALTAGQKMLTYHRPSRTGIFADVQPSREIQIGNALINPMFDQYTTTDVPDGWTTTSMTVVMETGMTYGGCRRSLKCLTDGATVANLTQIIPERGRWKGQTVSVYAWVYSRNANEMYLRVNQASTTNDSSLHGGTGWEKLTVSVPIVQSGGSGATLSSMSVAVRSTTAATVQYFAVQNVWFPMAPSDEHVYSIDADQNLIAISDLRVSGKLGDSGGNAGNFKDKIVDGAWEIVPETTRKIRLHIGSEYNECVLEYQGYKAHTELTAATTSFASLEEPILQMAHAILTVNAIGQSSGVDLEAVRMKLLKAYGHKLPTNARVGEWN